MLVVLGSLWSAIGAVLLVMVLLSANPSALPDWAEPAASDAAALGSLALVGVTGVAAGLAQLASGLAVQRGVGWGARVGLATALVGGLVTGAWLVGGIARGEPALIFLPVLVAYAHAAWALAIQRPA